MSDSGAGFDRMIEKVEDSGRESVRSIEPRWRRVSGSRTVIDGELRRNVRGNSSDLTIDILELQQLGPVGRPWSERNGSQTVPWERVERLVRLETTGWFAGGGPFRIHGIRSPERRWVQDAAPYDAPGYEARLAR